MKRLANWYGVRAEFKSYPSRECPLCGAELEARGDWPARVAECSCGFYEDADFVPFHHWLKELGLPLPKHPIRKLTKRAPPPRRAREGGGGGAA